MNTRYDILPRTVRLAASIAAVFCTAVVLASIAGLAEVAPATLAQSAPVVVASSAAEGQAAR